MKLRKIFTTALIGSALLINAGNIGANPPGDTSGNGGQNGSNMEEMTTTGIIMELNTTDSMLILQTDTATDTLYITPDTKMPPTDKLSQGSRVQAKYMEKQGRKELVSVEPQNAQGTSFRRTAFKNTTSNGGNGSNGKGQMMLTGTIEQISPDDSMMVVRTQTATDTVYFNEKTKMNMDQINEGTQVQIRYKEKQGRKVATEITMKNGQNGQRESNGTTTE